jgi:hypothetical protein
MNAKSRPFGIALEDFRHRFLEDMLIFEGSIRALSAPRRRQTLLHGIDIPQRCIDRIELGLLAVIRKAIRHHAFRYRR